jgi:putative acetyltransferase
MPLIRPALADDFIAVAQIFHESIHHLAARDYTKEQLETWSGAKRSAEHWRIRTKDLKVKIAWMENTPAGFIGYSHDGHIDLLFTCPSFARRGIARALVLDAESDLLSRKTATAWTEASLTARTFFEAMGYTMVREQTVRCNGVDLNNCRMDKALLPPPR